MLQKYYQFYYGHNDCCCFFFMEIKQQFQHGFFIKSRRWIFLMRRGRGDTILYGDWIWCSLSKINFKKLLGFYPQTRFVWYRSQHIDVPLKLTTKNDEELHTYLMRRQREIIRIT